MTPSPTDAAPFVFRHPERHITYFLTLFCVLLSLVGRRYVAAQPVIYPTPENRDRDVYVYDEGMLLLTPHPGAMERFFCETCPNDVVLYTSESSIDFVVNWLNENGSAIIFPQDVDIIASGLQETIGPTSRRSTQAVIRLELLSRRVLAQVRVLSGEWDRRVRVRKISMAPSVNMEVVGRQAQVDHFEYTMLVYFSTDVVWDPTSPRCPPMQRIDDQNVNRSQLVERSQRCYVNLLEKVIDSGIEIRGADQFDILVTGSSELYVVARTANKNETADIVTTVNEGYTDFAGNALTGRSFIVYHRPFPPPKTRQRRLLRREVIFPVKNRFSGKLAGQVATVAVAGASAASFATAGASGGTGTGSSVTMLNNVQKLHMTGMLAVSRMPGNYQNFTGEVKWAVLDVKTPWQRSNNKTTNGTRRGNATRSLKVIGGEFEQQEEESALDYFERMIFWVPALFIVVVVVHVLIIVYLVVKERPLPVLLQPPRLELMLSFFVLPPISIAAAGLFEGPRENALLGTWIIVAIPCSFLVWNFFMIWFYVLRLPPHMREVNLIMDIPNKKQRAWKQIRRAMTIRRREQQTQQNRNPSFAEHSQVRLVNDEAERSDTAAAAAADNQSPEDSETRPHVSAQRSQTMHREAVHEEEESGVLGEDSSETEPPTCGEILTSLSNMSFMTLLFGSHQGDAEWITSKTQGSKFNARFGMLFEEHRGPTIGRRDVTYEVDAESGRVDRGELVILKERPLISLPIITHDNGRLRFSGLHIYRYHLQMMAKLLDISKTILVGCIIAGVGETEDNAASIVALIAASLVLLLLFRIAKPFPSRVDMFMLVLAELADLIVYTCALFLILGPETDEDVTDEIGLALLLSEAFALLAVILEYTILSVGFGMEWYEGYSENKQNKFFHLVHQLLMQNEKYLMKKYFDRWMVRTLYRGLNGRIPDRHELPWRQAVKVYLQYLWEIVYMYLEESKRVWEDAVAKVQRSSAK